MDSLLCDLMDPPVDDSSIAESFDFLLNNEGDSPRDQMVVDARSTAYDSISAFQEKSPAQTLPFDILREIFLFSVTFASPLYPFQSAWHKYVLSPSHHREPISFLHVCRWWRDAALSVPKLWQAVSACPESTGRSTSGALRVWMLHASQVVEARQKGSHTGLDLHFAPPHVMATYSPREIKYMEEALPILLHHAQVCRSLSLCLDKKALDNTSRLFIEVLEANKHPGPQAPLLEDLELMFTSSTDDSPDQLDTICGWVDHLPSLRRLRLHFTKMCEDLNILASLETLPLQRVQAVLIAAPMSLENSLFCLLKCITAESITLSKMGWAVPSAGHLSALLTNPTISLLNLTSLSLSDSDGPAVLLHFLYLPVLQHLVISIQRFHRTDDSILALEPFLTRSKCPLEFLKISDPRMQNSVAVQLLRIQALRNAGTVDLCYRNAGRLLKDNFYGRNLNVPPLPKDVGKVMAWRSLADANEHIGWKVLEADEKLLHWIKDGTFHEERTIPGSR